MNKQKLFEAINSLNNARRSLFDAYREVRGDDYPEHLDRQLSIITSELVSKYHRLKWPGVKWMIHYQIKPGDCLSLIAERLGSTVEQIMEANSPAIDSHPDLIFPHDWLWIPTTVPIVTVDERGKVPINGGCKDTR